MIEYLLVLILSVMLSIQIVNRFTDFFRDSMGNLAHVLTINLMTGVCERECLYQGYKNQGQP